MYSSIFERDYLTDRAPRDPNSCCTESDDYITQGLRGPAPYLYVSPMAIRPRVGTLAQITSAQLDSPSAARGVPYQYYVAYQAQGRIPAQRFVVRPAGLATERAGFYAAAASRGYLSNFESFPVQDGASTAVLWPGRFPLRLTMYLSAARGLSWATSYIPWARVLNFNGGQAAPPQAFRPGQRLTDAWGAYPQHPAATVRLAGQAGPAGASATRAGNVLGLAMTAFGDNTPGHIGQYIGAPFKVTARYQLDQDGTRSRGRDAAPLPRLRRRDRPAAAGPVPDPVRAGRDAAGRAQPAVHRQPDRLDLVVGPRGARHAAARLGVHRPGQPRMRGAAAADPALCRGGRGRDRGGPSRPAGDRLAVGHVQPSRATRITRAAMSVSFNGGRTWHAGPDHRPGRPLHRGVQRPGRGAGDPADQRRGRGRAARSPRPSPAPTGSRPRAGAARAACPPAGPRRARCFTRYAPQTAVNAALAAQAAGRRARPARPGPAAGAPRPSSPPTACRTGQGAGQTVALVDAYSTPHLARDLGVLPGRLRAAAVHHGQRLPAHREPAGPGVPAARRRSHGLGRGGDPGRVDGLGRLPALQDPRRRGQRPRC